jgi:Ca2+:H+ antiporter
VTLALEHFAPERSQWIFLASALAIVPLASWMGHATEALAARTGEGVGGFLNATFGNAAELIIAIAALRAGLHDVVKASLAGSIIGNILLVLGAAMLAGGVRNRPEQSFNAPGARSQATMLTLAAIALVLPAAFQWVLGSGAPSVGSLSLWISIVLLAVYAANLWFSLGTHRALFAGHAADESHEAPWSVRKAAGVLAAAIFGIAWMSEILVGAIEPTAHELIHRRVRGRHGRDPRQRSRARDRSHCGAQEPHGPVALAQWLERAGRPVRRCVPGAAQLRARRDADGPRLGWCCRCCCRC